MKKYMYSYHREGTRPSLKIPAENMQVRDGDRVELYTGINGKDRVNVMVARLAPGECIRRNGFIEPNKEPHKPKRDYLTIGTIFGLALAALISYNRRQQ